MSEISRIGLDTSKAVFTLRGAQLASSCRSFKA
jgi:hypothetical protein